MIEAYNDLPVMYKAKLSNGYLQVEEVTAHVYRRTGMAGLGVTKYEAAMMLVRRIKLKAEDDVQRVEFQAGKLFCDEGGCDG